MTRAIVLVGGFGTRLRPLTNATPKQMLPIVNRPMIEHVLEHLARHGITDAVLSLGFQPDAFRDAYPDGVCGSTRLDYAIEPEPLDTAGAIRFAAHAAGIDERVVVLNGDVLTDLDVTALIERHEAAGAEASIALHKVADPSAFGVVPTDPDGRVEAFVEKPPPGEAPTDLINAGTYVLEPSVFGRIPADRPVSIERKTFPELVAAGTLFAWSGDTYWIDTGTPRNYLDAQLDLLDGVRGAPVDGLSASAQLDGADVVRSVVGPGVRVGAGSVVRNSVVMSGACIGERVEVLDSIVGPGARVADDAIVCNLSVLGADADVGARRDGRRGQASGAGLMRALVTGGAGFIGSTLVDRLLTEGHDVDVVDDLSSGKLANLAEARAASQGKVTFHQIDVRDPGIVELFARRKPEVVFHLAAQIDVRVSVQRPTFDADVNIVGGVNVIEAARLAGARKVVFASSGGTIYGQVAEDDLPVTEAHPQTPLSPYGVAKKCVGDYLMAYRELHGLEFTALALANVYGPRQDPHGEAGVVAIFAGRLLDGAAVHDLRRRRADP